MMNEPTTMERINALRMLKRRHDDMDIVMHSKELGVNYFQVWHDLAVLRTINKKFVGVR